MEIYKNLNHDSGIAAYQTGEDHIKVQFKDRAIYLYSYKSCGLPHIEQMKALAGLGRGLNSYINRHVRKLYEVKLA